ncbi:MAG: histidine phosphatase family protein [Pseudomonadales bacterium]|jgi:phosphohistidine phosphatase|nr:histidine phosphatase family protein [Pseudomonadales bacterium]
MTVEDANTLLLLRHAKSSWREPALADFERPLSGRGVRDGTRFGPRIARVLPRPDLVLCSPSRRTRDTLAFLIPELVDPRRVRFEDGLYRATASELLRYIRSTPPAVRTLLVLAHNPGLTDLANLLPGGDDDALENLPTFGCVRFALTVPFSELDRGGARLVALLRPKDAPPGEP